MNKKQFSKKIKNNYDIYMLKNIISICEDKPISEFHKLSKEELIDRSYEYVEDHTLLYKLG